MGNKSEFDGCVNKDDLFQSNCHEIVEAFELMGLDNDLLASIVYDFKNPTLVQQRAIKPCIDNNEHDVIIEAPSGSGKTTAVAISLLQLIDLETDECQALILVPDFKNALQVQEVISVLSDFAPSFKSHVCDSERRLIEERRCYDIGVHVLVGTPASVLRLFAHDAREQKTKIRYAVLDGVNELLLGSCKSQVYEIFGSHLVSCSRIIVLSTTLPKELTEFKDDFMNETVQIIVKKDDLFSFHGVKQFHLTFDDEKKKLNLLNSLCNTFNSVRVIIYCSNRRNVDELALQLERLGHSVLSMHVESVAVREQVSKYFSAGCCNMLITCNYLGYEFELPKSVVINYDLPQNPANYKSRLGHNFGCARKFLVVNFVSDSTRRYLTNVEKFYKINIVEMPSDCSIFLKDLHVVKLLPFLKSDFLSYSRSQSSTEISAEYNMNGAEEGGNFLSKKRRKISDNQAAVN
ncbi:hypothetical protein V9T40_000267 [Parthenolecanium corni]|uniref:ATP-dependent RNA helicase n=1 Tax=Parthenolecanium corni TaxID=536013 RepID=A0AAN9T910_9HEMI